MPKNHRQGIEHTNSSLLIILMILDMLELFKIKSVNKYFVLLLVKYNTNPTLF